MEVYVKESLHVLDYRDNVVDSIFISDDHMTPGYAYDITITEANTGYSDLKFNMPNMVIDGEGNKIHNPRLKLLTPLVKLRYHREVYYRGDKEITVREPQGYGDKVVYIDKTYKPTYPENIIEDYIMDYIVQPVDKKRDVLKLTTAFTAIDYPRFNLSKKKVGLAIGQDTLAANEDWSLYENKPMDVPGTIKYQPWSNSLTLAAGGDTTKVPLEWDPKNAETYPLDEVLITNLMNNTASWPYGLLGTAFYWPIVSTSRFEGTMYTEGGYLVLQLYDFYQLTKEGIDPEKHIGRYSWEWTYLTEVQKYLTPNNAKNYLYHILDGTNWSVKLRDDGTPDVDIVKVDVPNPAGSETTEQVDHTCNISVSNSNCYNAITAVCKGLQLYPIYDCVNREVSLRAFAGKNYGLTYNLGSNLTSNGVKKDGEKVITKLYVTGGKDYNGDQNINIGEAERSYLTVSMLPDDYQQIDYIQSSGTQYIDTGVILNQDSEVRVLFKPVKAESAIVFGSRSSATKNNFSLLLSAESNRQTAVLDFYDYTKNRVQTEVINDTAYLVVMNNLELRINDVKKDISTYEPFNTPGNALIFNGAGSFPWSTKASIKLYECMISQNGTTIRHFIPCYRKSDGEVGLIDIITGQFYTNLGTGTFTKGPSGAGDSDNRLPWNPNDPGYIIKRSPYGTNYILNFKWMYDNGWIQKEEILDIYNINQQINDLNKEFMIPYTEDRLRTLQEYNDAVNQYDLKQGEYQATLNSMMNKYYKIYGEYSKGTFYAFHKVPQGTHTKDGKHYVWIGYCPTCKKAWASVNKPGNCTCGNTNTVKEEIYIPLYDDFTKSGTIVPPELKYPYGTGANVSGPAYEPYLKGDFLKLVTTLDNQNNNDAWDITYYEGKVSLVTPLNPTAQPIDGYEYEIDGVKVKASSGNIDEWNRNIALYVAYYGEMLDAHAKMEYCLEKLKELDKEYDAWKAQYDGYQATIQDKYGDFLIEGNYTNNEQPYVNLLFNEGMEASDKFATPEVTYNLDVIDSTGLIEYRKPIVAQYECADCLYTSVAPLETCPKCQGANIVKSYDTYNDLVHLLHSVGQIVPKAGDYVTIYDEPMGLFGVPGLITEISRTLDKPMNNKIKLDTGYTDDEELVGNIITATNTVLNNADIYARTAVLKADGTIDSASISKSLDNPNASLNIVGTNGNMLLTGSYLRFTDPSDATRAIKYSGTGIFTTSTLNEKEENVEWQKMLTPTGINATYINAGQIDTKNISIMSGLTSKVLIDQYGLVVKNNGNKAAHITTFDTSKATTDANYVKNWGTTNNIAGFMGVDTKNNPIVYTKGFLVAENGSNIANWITSDKGFYHLNASNQKDLWLSPTGMDGTVNDTAAKYAIYANGNFGVTTNGNMYATGVNIKGTITSDNVTITGGTLKIGSNFEVSNSGVLKASGATISGTLSSNGGTFTNITATGGTFTNISATNGTFKDISVTGNSTFSGSLSGATGTFKGELSAATGTFKGTLSAASGSFSGTITATGGSIGGWDITKDSGIESDHANVRPNGTAAFYPQSAAGAEYIFKDSMTLHSTSAQTIESGANIMIEASTNLNLKSGEGSYLRLQGGLGIRINGPISVSTSYDGARETAKDEWQGVIHIDGTNKTFRFVNGLLISVT